MVILTQKQIEKLQEKRFRDKERQVKLLQDIRDGIKDKEARIKEHKNNGIYFVIENKKADIPGKDILRPNLYQCDL